jgi:hypothetical protein
MSHAISLDSVMNLPAMGIPVVNYSPESTWEFGAAAQGYFRLPNQERTSIVQLDGTYSLNHQWYINAQGTLYFKAKGERREARGEGERRKHGNCNFVRDTVIAQPPIMACITTLILQTKAT